MEDTNSKLNLELKELKNKFVEEIDKINLENCVIKQKLQKCIEDSNMEVKELKKKVLQINGATNIDRNLFKEKINEFDIQINCDSFLRPFKIKTTERYRNYLKKKEHPIVTVMGNFDKGKSFILSELSKREFPSGFNVTTPSICGFYPPEEYKDEKKDFESLNALLLDTAGFETAAQYQINVIIIKIYYFCIY